LQFGRQHYREDRLELILLASEDCNFRCRYCYEDFPRGTMEPGVRAGVQRLLASRVPTVRSLMISWFGGEPLYGLEAIREIAPAAQAMAREHHVEYDSYITTNAYLLTPDVARDLVSWGIRRFQITVDGPQEIHDASRPLQDGGPTFETIMANVKAMRSLPERFLVVLRINFYKDTADALPPFIRELARDFGDDPRFVVAFHPVGKWGGPNDEELNVCGSREGQVRALELMRATHDLGLPTRGSILNANGVGAGVCYAARPYNLIIGADGKVMKCTIALGNDPRNIVGALSPDGAITLDERKLAAWVAPSFETDKVCRDCSLVATCQGISCPLVRIVDGHRPCASTPKPALAAHLTTARHLARTKHRNGDDRDASRAAGDAVLAS
jgi:uncharacterized protein